MTEKGGREGERKTSDEWTRRIFSRHRLKRPWHPGKRAVRAKQPRKSSQSGGHVKYQPGG